MSVNIYKNGKLVSLDSSANSHMHNNKSVIDKFSENADGKILYDGKQIEGTASGDCEHTSEIDDLTVSTDKTWSSSQINKQVNRINIAQKTVNKNLDYCYCSIDIENALPITLNQTIPFVKKNGNLDYDMSNYSVKLKAGKTYDISFGVFAYGILTYTLYDITNNTALKSGNIISTNININSPSLSTQHIYYVENDCQVQIRATYVQNASVNRSDNLSYFLVKELDKSIVIDPVNYINESQGIEDTPVGHIISHMGTTAPKHYLICDGTTYNILDYPYLANHIKTDFGSYNYFGGDGIDTFAVPDLRNNFIRGYHGDAESISGDIGKFQEPTYHINVGTGGLDKKWVGGYFKGNDTLLSSLQDEKKIDSSGLIWAYGSQSISTGHSNNISRYTSRPRNTAVLFCIKYEPTYFMNLTGIRIKEILWEGNVSNASTLVLSDNYDNYDELVFVCVATSGQLTDKVSKSYYTSDIENDVADILIHVYENRYIEGHFTSEKNNFVIDLITGNHFPALTKIYGVRYNTVQKSSEVSL